MSIPVRAVIVSAATATMLLLVPTTAIGKGKGCQGLFACNSGGGDVVLNPSTGGGGGGGSAAPPSSGGGSYNDPVNYGGSGGSGAGSSSGSGGGVPFCPVGMSMVAGSSVACMSPASFFGAMPLIDLAETGAAGAGTAVVPAAVQLPSPAELAQQAIELMDLQAVTIGSAPGAGKRGFVGLPVWLWVENPTANTFGPLTESASAGPITVTATAKVDSITWDMGDGATVTCTTPGTPYADRFGTQDSPDCGHRYEQTSADEAGNEYTVTATAHWVVNWSGGGQAGVINIDHTASTRFAIGEVQVLNQ